MKRINQRKYCQNIVTYNCVLFHKYIKLYIYIYIQNDQVIHKLLSWDGPCFTDIVYIFQIKILQNLKFINKHEIYTELAHLHRPIILVYKLKIVTETKLLMI